MLPVTRKAIINARLAPIAHIRSFIRPTAVRWNENDEITSKTQVSRIAAPEDDPETLALIKVAEAKKNYEIAAKNLLNAKNITDEQVAEYQAKLEEVVPKEKLTSLLAELEDFLYDSSNDHKFETEKRIKSERGDTTGSAEFPYLIPSKPNQPYSKQELFLRQLTHTRTMSHLGAHLKDTIHEKLEYLKPKTIESIRTETLLAAGCHLGHSTDLLRSNNQPFISGVYKGINIIDLEKTASHLKRACKVIQGVAAKGGLILYIGTREGQLRSLQEAANRSGGYYVATRWAPGTLTNCTEISRAWPKVEVDAYDRPTNRQLDGFESKSLIKPDLVVILNPTQHRIAINEAIKSRIPTIGIIDTDSEPSLITYPIPANDDSVRSTNLIIGVLSKAAEQGRYARFQNVINNTNEEVKA